MKKYILTLILASLAVAAAAQQKTVTSENYRRSSLYSLLVSHPKQEFSKEIQSVFLQIPIPEKFDDHSLSVKIVASDQPKEESQPVIDKFLVQNNIARRLVGKWFDRDPAVGYFDMDLIAQRGQYDADYYDVNMARLTTRGEAMLADAGEELIGNTFVLVNDIKYNDRQQTAKVVGGIFRALTAIAGAALGNSNISDMGNSMGSLIEKINGFGVTVTSYLYRLEWNDETAATLYKMYYMTPQMADAARKTAFDKDNKTFHLRFIGKQAVTTGKTSMEGINPDTPEQMIRKVCTRAIDKSIVQLQLEHDEFRVKTPIFSLTPNISAKIGMKEGVAADSRFEVLERYEDQDGHTQYKRVGVIAPVSGRIWDNRYMAAEERTAGSDLTCTEFKKVSGNNFTEGMLIRQIKAK